MRAASVTSKIMPVKEDKSFVEPDVEKLCKYVCINYYVEGLFLSQTLIIVYNE